MNRMKTKLGQEHVFKAVEHATHEWLMTREIGGKLRDQLVKMMADATADDTVVIDFTGLQAMTYSFADEFIGKLLKLREADLTPAVAVVVTGLTPDPLETIELVLERRSLPLLAHEDEGSRLLGDDSHLKDTYHRALAMGDFKAAEIAEQLGISAQNANNRLKKLSGVGALRRHRASSERGGKEFTYSAVR